MSTYPHPSWRHGETSLSKPAKTDHPIHELLSDRWSPTAFSSRPVPDEDLRSVFEAARWTASSYNEQPWGYIVATRADDEGFERLLSCLVDANAAWAKEAPVLALACTRLTFGRNGRPNAAAEHDLGAAGASLTLEATARGLRVHQMIGILPDRARVLYGIPDDVRPFTCLAIGYAGDPAASSREIRERDLAPRLRKPLSELVYEGHWGTASGLVT
jgi:nitroreductase